MILYHDDPRLSDAILSFQSARDAGIPRRLYLAEGDSWFSLGGATSNLLMALDSDDALIVSCAYPGDTIRDMSQLGGGAFRHMMRINRDVGWDGVLLSGGGNDLLADVGMLLDGSNVSRARVAVALDVIEAGYRSMVEIVRRYDACPIHAHTYDYPVSDYRGGWFRLGPWVGKRLVAAGVTPNRHAAIIYSLIDRLADCIRSVDGLTVHDTRGTLTPRPWGWLGGQRHWRNEIHPTVLGYDLLATRWKL